MIAVLLITVLFVCLSVYFFFRAEKLQHTIVSLKRDMAKIQKENQVFSKSMALMAGNGEEFVNNRLNLLLNETQCQKTLNEIMLIKPFIENYSLIFKECLMRKGKLHSTTQKCFLGAETDSYKDFINVVVKKDKKVQRLWNSNNFIGFISLTEALLVKYEDKSKSDLAVESTVATLS